MRTAEEKLAFKRQLEERTAEFPVAVFRSLDTLPNKVSSRVIAFQLGKSASSVGANYREANRAESPDDFIHKIGIALKECSESIYWLTLLSKLYPDRPEIGKQIKECDELLRIFQTIRTKTHQRKARQ